jgi:hypothetical protein
MQFTVTDAINRMDDLLNDTSRARWTDTIRRRWLLDAQQIIISAEPNAALVELTLPTLTANEVYQTPFNGQAEWRAVVDVTHLVVSGQMRDTIRYISRPQMDAQRPNWMREPASSTPLYWMPSDNDPRSFFIYPKPKAGVIVAARMVRYPTNPATETPALRPDFKAAWIHLATALCFMGDDTPGDRENVATHLAMSANGLRAAGVADDKIIQQIVTRTPPR